MTSIIFAGVPKSPSPIYQWAAAYVGAIAQSLRNDLGRPLQTLPVNGVLRLMQLSNSVLLSVITYYTVAYLHLQLMTMVPCVLKTSLRLSEECLWR